MNVTLYDSDIGKDDLIGSMMIELDELQKCGKLCKWYPLQYKDKKAGEILIELEKFDA